MISRDEGLHTDFACHLYELLRNRWACCRDAAAAAGQPSGPGAAALVLGRWLRRGTPLLHCTAPHLSPKALG